MEKTIEQRAAIIAVEVIANAVQVIEHHDAETLQGIKHYIVQELEKQRKIDIEKACEWMMNFKFREEFPLYDYVGNFRKAMEG